MCLLRATQYPARRPGPWYSSSMRPTQGRTYRVFLVCRGIPCSPAATTYMYTYKKGTYMIHVQSMPYSRYYVYVFIPVGCCASWVVDSTSARAASAKAERMSRRRATDWMARRQPDTLSGWGWSTWRVSVAVVWGLAGRGATCEAVRQVCCRV